MNVTVDNKVQHQFVLSDFIWFDPMLRYLCWSLRRQLVYLSTKMSSLCYYMPFIAQGLDRLYYNLIGREPVFVWTCWSSRHNYFRCKGCLPSSHSFIDANTLKNTWWKAKMYQKQYFAKTCVKKSKIFGNARNFSVRSKIVRRRRRKCFLFKFLKTLSVSFWKISR